MVWQKKAAYKAWSASFQLIEHLAAHPTGVSLQTLAGETGPAKSTVHRLLASLVRLGYAAQDEENGHYRLTLKMFELSSGIVDSMHIMGVSKAHLERSPNAPARPCIWSSADGRDIVYIYKTESGPMRMSSRGPAQPAVLHRRGQGHSGHPAPAMRWRISGPTAMRKNADRTHDHRFGGAAAASWWRSAPTATPLTMRRVRLWSIDYDKTVGISDEKAYPFYKRYFVAHFQTIISRKCRCAGYWIRNRHV